MTRRRHETWMQDDSGKKGTDVLVKAPIKSRWFHPETGRIHRIHDICFDSERKRWMLVYVAESDVDYAAENGTHLIPYCYLPEDFHREGRFVRVTE